MPLKLIESAPIIMNFKSVRKLLICLITLSILSGCGDGNETDIQSPLTTPSGKSRFVSAEIPTFPDPDDQIQEVKLAELINTKSLSIQERDIFRFINSGKTLLTTNPYRGLEILDVGDSSQPKIIGRAAFSGYPVEMYQSGQHVYVLLNGWNDVRRKLVDGKETLDQYHGAGIVTIDISNLNAPKIMSSKRVDGYIQASYFKSVNGNASLYLACNSDQINLHSFNVDSSGNVKSKSHLSLKGYVSTIYASNDRLLVAGANVVSTATLVDISSVDGGMRLGAEIPVSGLINKDVSRINIEKNILRIASEMNWMVGDIYNHAESFDITDIDHPIALDHVSFGLGQQLRTARYLPNRAVFVTYQSGVGSILFFSSDANGKMLKENEFYEPISHEFVAMVSNNNHLITIGRAGQYSGSLTLAVSLYDISNEKSKAPLLARTEVKSALANWDQLAFSVLENATNIIAPDGRTNETGLVLLPFTAWNEAAKQNQSSVQILSFSDTTVTNRDTLDQPEKAHQSFVVSPVANPAGKSVANFAESKLSFIDFKYPNKPIEKSSVNLAPNYRQFLAFNSVGVRYKNNEKSAPREKYSTTSISDTLEVVSLTSVNSAEIIASIPVPAGSKIYQLAENLITVSPDTEQSNLVSISTWSLRDPNSPVLLSKFSSSDLAPENEWWCAKTVYTSIQHEIPEATVVGNALVFAHRQTCNLINGSPFVQTSNSYEFQAIDFSNPAQPVILPSIRTALDEDVVGIVQDGSKLWINFKRPLVKLPQTPDGQAQSEYFTRVLDFTIATKPQGSKAINIPGVLMAVSGNRLYTRDLNWKTKKIEESVNVLIVQNDKAYLQASIAMNDQVITDLLLDGDRVVVRHYENETAKLSLTVLQLRDNTFTVQSKTTLKNWPKLLGAYEGRVLLGLYNGYVLYDIRDPNAAIPQAFYPAQGSEATLTLRRGEFFIPASFYGIYQFKFNSVNLGRI